MGGVDPLRHRDTSGCVTPWGVGGASKQRHSQGSRECSEPAMLWAGVQTCCQRTGSS